MLHFQKIISFFVVSLLFATTNSTIAFSQSDVNQAYELAYVEEDGEFEKDCIKYSVSIENLRAAGGGDDSDINDEIAVSNALILPSIGAITALNDFKSLLLSQYMLALANSVHTPDLFILYSCPKAYLS